MLQLPSQRPIENMLGHRQPANQRPRQSYVKEGSKIQCSGETAMRALPLDDEARVVKGCLRDGYPRDG